MPRWDSTPRPPHFCEVCGNEIVDTGKRGPAYVAARRACSQACRAELAWRVRTRKADIQMPSRTCQWCGEEFDRAPQEDPKRFTHRRFCSVPCVSANANYVHQRRLYGDDMHRDRHCGYCNTLLVRRDDESFAKFMARHTCDIVCGAKFMGINKRVPEHLRRGTYGPAFYRMREVIRERDHHTCQLCGALPSTTAHAVHHIDYDKDNCDPDNLITLCRVCHTKTNYNREAWMELFADMLNGDRS